jgi:NAD(P) transhydrogenase subunit alpha
VAITIAIPRETAESEKRVAASPETIKKLVTMGCKVVIEAGAGEDSSFTDKMFKDAGAKVAKTREEAVKGADIVLRVQVSQESDLRDVKKGALLIGLMSPYQNETVIQTCAKQSVDAFSMELVPRITRAQAMDVLSSQSNLAGYKSVLDATEHFGSAFPMMMTAAGTVPPAKVFVMGAGVAGLQAIATAKRLGAVVSATDVRPAAKEQVESLGGTFVAVEDDEFKEAESAGGYAKEMSKEYKEKQAALVEEHIAKQDIVITTALIPGRPAPKLISEKMIKSMKPGSVVVDLAVEMGGNCAGSKVGKVVSKDGVTIVGHKNVPSRLAHDASSLYSRNLLNLLKLIVDEKEGKISVDYEDEIIKGVALTRSGEIIHPNFSKKKESSAAAKKAPAKKKESSKKKESEKVDSKEEEKKAS